MSTHLEMFLATGADNSWTAGLPAYVVRELRSNLRCGILAYLELETDPAPVQSARAPPQLELAF